MKKNRLLKSFIFFDLLIIGSLAAYLILNPEKQVLDSSIRNLSSSTFIELSDGFVHYELSGNPAGETVVLVHGFSVPMYVWDPTVEGLESQGYQVLRYDLYGRGFSDRPNVEYDQALFVRQLSELTDTIIPNTKFHLMGLSMGGPIVAAFANQNIDRVKSVALIAPEVLKVEEKEIFPMNIPIIGEWIVGVYLVPFRLPNSQPEDFYNPEKFPGWVEKYREQIQYKGFKNAILSTIRNLVKTDPLEEYKSLAETGLPTLLIWGKEDRTISYEAIVKLLEVIPEIDYQFIEEAGHLPHYEQSQEVNTFLLQFIGSIE